MTCPLHIKSPPLWLARVFAKAVAFIPASVDADPGLSLMRALNPQIDVRRVDDDCKYSVGSYGLCDKNKNPLGTFVGFYPRAPKAWS